MNNMVKRISIIAVMICLVVAFMPALGGSAHAASVKLNKKTVYLAKGKTVKLKVKGTKAKVKWSSSNKKIATVSKSGKVKGKKIGKCTITAKVKGKKLKCKVIVESKAANQARKLRNYVLKKGKYDKDNKEYVLSAKYEDEEQETVEFVDISANKKNKKLEFAYSFTSPNTIDTTITSMEYDLIKGKSGSFSIKVIDGGNSEDETHYQGTITRKFAQSGKGLTITSATKTEFDEENYEAQIVGVTPDSDDYSYCYNNMAHSFKMFDKLLKQKKAGTSMYKLGFTKWKK